MNYFLKSSNHEIQVYSAPQLSCFPEVPMPACYARIVDNWPKAAQIQLVTKKLTSLHISDKDINAAGNSAMAAKGDDEVGFYIFLILLRLFW